MANPKRMSKITTIEMTGTVLSSVTIGRRKWPIFEFNPDATPKKIPSTVATDMATISLMNVIEIAKSPVEVTNKEANAFKVARGLGKRIALSITTDATTQMIKIRKTEPKDQKGFFISCFTSRLIVKIIVWKTSADECAVKV